MVPDRQAPSLMAGDHSFVTSHPGILALVIARVVIGLLIAVALFLPGAAKGAAA